MDTGTKVFQCSHIGVSGTTPVHVKQLEDGTFKARVGIAVMGFTNMDESGFEACGHNPFHPEFNDNWAEGTGPTEEAAIAAMKAEMRDLADSMW